MRVFPAAVERFLCPSCSWRIELRSAFLPAECARLLAERHAKNVVEDFFHRPGRSASELRWTGSVSDNRFDIVEAGGIGSVRALGTIEEAPRGSTIDMTFRLETGQFIWDLLLITLGTWTFWLLPNVYSAYIVAGVVILFVLRHVRRWFETSLDAGRLVGLVQDAMKGEIVKAEGGVHIGPAS